MTMPAFYKCSVLIERVSDLQKCTFERVAVVARFELCAVCAIAKISASFGLKFVFTFAAAMHFDKLLQELHSVALTVVAVANVGHFCGEAL